MIPLNYGRVHRLKADFPGLGIVVNGGIKTAAQAAEQLARVDGVMIGRAAYQDPYCLASMEQTLFDDPRPVPSRHEIVARLLPYVERQRRAGVPLKCMTRHILGLFNGMPGARAWRRHLSVEAHHPDAGVDVIEAALSLVPAIDHGAAAA